MLLQQLKHLDSFAHLRWSELNTIARHTQVLSIPRTRWLLRRGRQLTGAYFLTRGKLRLWAPEHTLAAGDRAASRPFYPGAVAAHTLTDVQLLQIDIRPIAFLLESLPGNLAGFDVRDEPWLARFLDSALMRRLDPGRWQRVLRGMSTRRVTGGAPVLVEGQSGSHFYVIKGGRALVHRGRRQLATLGPGDFFGEDALIAGAPRNASVTALTDCALLRLPRRAFLELLVRGSVPSARQVSGDRARRVSIDPVTTAAALHLPLHDLRLHLAELEQECDYYVSGSDRRATALAAFILLQRGYRAWVLTSDQPARPAPCVQLPSSEVG